MSLTFKYIPLSFQSDQLEIRSQIRNTLILKYIFKKYRKVQKLGSLIEGTQYGYNDSAKDSGRNKFLRISDIKNGEVNWDSVPFCNCDDEETYFLRTNDILVARTGGTTGKSFKILDPPDSSIYAGYLIRIRANDKIIPDYLNVFLNSYAYWSQIVSLNEGNFRPRVNANSLKSLEIPICTLQVQQQVVDISNGNYSFKNYEELFKELTQMENCNELEAEYQYALEQLQKLKESLLLDSFESKTIEYGSKK